MFQSECEDVLSDGFGPCMKGWSRIRLSRQLTKSHESSHKPESLFQHDLALGSVAARIVVEKQPNYEELQETRGRRTNELISFPFFCLSLHRYRLPAVFITAPAPVPPTPYAEHRLEDISRKQSSTQSAGTYLHQFSDVNAWHFALATASAHRWGKPRAIDPSPRISNRVFPPGGINMLMSWYWNMAMH